MSPTVQLTLIVGLLVVFAIPPLFRVGSGAGHLWDRPVPGASFHAKGTNTQSNPLRHTPLNRTLCSDSLPLTDWQGLPCQAAFLSFNNASEHVGSSKRTRDFSQVFHPLDAVGTTGETYPKNDSLNPETH